VTCDRAEAEGGRQVTPEGSIKRHGEYLNWYLDRALPHRSPDLVLSIPKRPPSQNVLNKRHWRFKHTTKGEWKLELCAALAGRKVGPFFHVLIIRMGPGQMGTTDPDNIIGGCKSCVVDNLRELHLLTDDTRTAANIHYWEQPAKLPTTEIYLWENIVARSIEDLQREGL
jgi:hypothetical protein